jgi:hypothetical protein
MKTLWAGFSKHETDIPPYCPTALLPDCHVASRVPGAWDPGPDQHRAPKTESGHRKTRTPGMHPVSCIHALNKAVVLCVKI